LPADVVARLRASVVRRESMAYEDAALTDAFETVAALLGAERDAISEWRVSRTGFHAVAAGFERTARASRRAMVKALATSRIEDYREWRQRVKATWLQVRLLMARCGAGLALDERRLEALDGYLGDCRNCAILRQILISDSLLDRGDAALGLRAVRRYERRLRVALAGSEPRSTTRRRGTSSRVSSACGTRHVGPGAHSRRGTPWRSAA
jgi:hypothetical protein